LNSEIEELQKKYNNNNNLYTDIYRDNERILREFDENKTHNLSIQNNKDTDIDNLKNERK
jgi:hypothetical protein